MIHALARHFIRNCTDTGDATVRRAWGALCGVVGVLLNLLLFGGKLLAGIVSGSIAATADAFNNLSDALSSVISSTSRRAGPTATTPSATAATSTSPG